MPSLSQGLTNASRKAVAHFTSQVSRKDENNKEVLEVEIHKWTLQFSDTSHERLFRHIESIRLRNRAKGGLLCVLIAVCSSIGVVAASRDSTFTVFLIISTILLALLILFLIRSPKHVSTRFCYSWVILAYSILSALMPFFERLTSECFTEKNLSQQEMTVSLGLFEINLAGVCFQELLVLMAMPPQWPFALASSLLLFSIHLIDLYTDDCQHVNETWMFHIVLLSQLLFMGLPLAYLRELLARRQYIMSHNFNMNERKAEEKMKRSYTLLLTILPRAFADKLNKQLKDASLQEKVKTTKVKRLKTHRRSSAGGTRSFSFLNLGQVRTAGAETRALLKLTEQFEDVSCMFAYVTGFDTIVAESPTESVELLNSLFTAFDNTIKSKERNGVEKIKTVGGVYICAGGISNTEANHLLGIVDAACKMMYVFKSLVTKSWEEKRIGLKIGLHHGPCVAGVIGRNQVCFDLWGDTINTASRMASTAPLGGVQLSHAAYEKASKFQVCIIPRGEIEVKGKGLMHTYLVDEKMYTKGRHLSLDARDSTLFVSTRASANFDSNSKHQEEEFVVAVSGTDRRRRVSNKTADGDFDFDPLLSNRERRRSADSRSIKSANRASTRRAAGKRNKRSSLPTIGSSGLDARKDDAPRRFSLSSLLSMAKTTKHDNHEERSTSPSNRGTLDDIRFTLDLVDRDCYSAVSIEPSKSALSVNVGEQKSPMPVSPITSSLESPSTVSKLTIPPEANNAGSVGQNMAGRAIANRHRHADMCLEDLEKETARLQEAVRQQKEQTKASKDEKETKDKDEDDYEMVEVMDRWTLKFVDQQLEEAYKSSMFHGYKFVGIHSLVVSLLAVVQFTYNDFLDTIVKEGSTGYQHRMLTKFPAIVSMPKEALLAIVLVVASCLACILITYSTITIIKKYCKENCSSPSRQRLILSLAPFLNAIAVFLVSVYCSILNVGTNYTPFQVFQQSVITIAVCSCFYYIPFWMGLVAMILPLTTAIATEVHASLFISLSYVLSIWVLCIISVYFREKDRRQEYYFRQQSASQSKFFEIHKQETEALLLTIFPPFVLSSIREEEQRSSFSFVTASYKMVSVLFLDVVGFTTWSSSVSPEEVVEALTDMFAAFDELTNSLQCQKIKTVGDAYHCVCGIPQADKKHAERITVLALQMQEWMKAYNVKRKGLFDAVNAKGELSTRPPPKRRIRGRRASIHLVSFKHLMKSSKKAKTDVQIQDTIPKSESKAEQSKRTRRSKSVQITQSRSHELPRISTSPSPAHMSNGSFLRSNGSFLELAQGGKNQGMGEAGDVVSPMSSASSPRARLASKPSFEVPFSPVPEPEPESDFASLRIRVGIASGPAVAGIVGVHKFSYDIWGETSMMAEEMESEGVPERVQVCQLTRQLLEEGYNECKGFGSGPLFKFEEPRPITKTASGDVVHGSIVLPWEDAKMLETRSKQLELLETKVHSGA